MDDSTTFQNYTAGQNKSKGYFTAGFAYDSPLGWDNLCVGNVSAPGQCYNSVILPVYDMRWNEWFEYLQLPQVNGVFGMAYFADYLQWNSFWFSMISQGYNTTMAISLLPQESDVDWIQAAPNCTNTT